MTEPKSFVRKTLHGAAVVRDMFFVADVHLSDCKEREKNFIRFLNMVAKKGGDLYILGDLFDYWANNRVVFKRNKPVLNAFRHISGLNVKITFLRGNRDFLVLPRVFSRWGVEVASDEICFSSGNEKIYLTHGHMLCPDNKAFLEYKKKYWPIFRVLDPILPGIIENWLAGVFMQKSKNAIKQASQESLKLSDKAVLEHLNSGASKVICGHIHKKMQKDFDNGSLYVLPPWDKNGGGYGIISGSNFCFEDFS